MQGFEKLQVYEVVHTISRQELPLNEVKILKTKRKEDNSNNMSQSKAM